MIYAINQYFPGFTIFDAINQNIPFSPKGKMDDVLDRLRSFSLRRDLLRRAYLLVDAFLLRSKDRLPSLASLALHKR